MIAETISPSSPKLRPRNPVGATSTSIGALPEPATRRRERLPPAWSLLILGAAAIVLTIVLVMQPLRAIDGGTDQQATQPASPQVPSVGPTLSAGTPVAAVHVIARGDTLRSIAEHYLGDESLWRRIYDANRDTISDPENLIVGMTIDIPPR